jgi:hypothetical protein
MNTQQNQWLEDLWNIFFSPYGQGGIAKWSNAEIFRRQLASLGAPYDPPGTLPFVPPTVTPGGGLTADQAAALAQVPALVAAVARIEAALKSA